MTPPLFQVSFSAMAEAAAHSLGDLIENDPTFDALSVGLTRSADRDDIWSVDMLCNEPPEAAQIVRWIEGLISAGIQPPQVSIEQLSERDWVSLSQQSLKPVRAGRFVIHGHHDRDRFQHHRFAIEIDAGQAFGTGHHGTTVGCLQALQCVILKHGPHRILDIGTGSGVLAIAAARLCPANIIASDIDPLAVATARANARINQIGNAVRFVEAAGLGAPVIRAHRHDLVIPNILARPLRALAGDIVRHLRPGGRIILSGLTAAQARPICAHYRAHGAFLERARMIEGWATLTLRSGQAPSKRKRPRPMPGSL